ncbi:uncharacterized protein LOC144327126 [Podarcis muralis]
MSWCHWAFELIQLLIFITLWVFWVAAALWACSPRTRWLKLHETWIGEQLPEPTEILTLECRLSSTEVNIPPQPKELEMDLDSVLSSVSSTSLGSLTSISSNWSLSSSSDDVISLPDTPLTSSPSAPEEDGRYSPLLHRPCGAGLEELHRDPTSHQPAQFNICQKVLQKFWGEPTPNWESLNELVPGVPNLQPASEVTSETDFDSISSRRSREEALSKWERHQPLSDQEEVQRSSSWEMFAVVPRPSSCPNCNPQTSRVSSGQPLALPTSNSIRDRLSPSGNTKPAHVKATAQLLEEMMSEGAVSWEERPALPKHPSQRGQLRHRRSCTALGSDATQRLDFNVKKKQMPELWGEPTLSTKSLAKLTCQAPLSPSPARSSSPPQRAEKERSRQSGPMSISPTSVKTRAQLLEAIMLRGGTSWKERPALPKPHSHKAHQAPRGPCTAISPDTAQHLEFNMKKKQMHNLWGEPTPLTHSLTCQITRSPSPAHSCSPPQRVEEEEEEEEEELFEPARAPSRGLASQTARGCSPQPIPFTFSQKGSTVQVAPKKRAEEGNEFRVAKRVTLPPTRSGFSESSLRSRFVSRGRTRRPRSSHLTSKSSPGIPSAPEKKVKASGMMGRAESLESKEAQSRHAGTESQRQPSKSIRKVKAISHQGASHLKDHGISPKEPVPVAKPGSAQLALGATLPLHPRQDALQQLEIRRAEKMMVPAQESAPQASRAPHSSSKKEIELSEKMKAPVRESAPQPSIEEGPQPAPHFSSKKEIQLSEQMEAPMREFTPQTSMECHQPPPLPFSSSVQHTLESSAGRGKEGKSLVQKAEDSPCSARNDTPMDHVRKSLAAGCEPHNPIDNRLISHGSILENQSKGAPFHGMDSAESPWEVRSCQAGGENTLDDMNRRKDMSHEDPPQLSLEENLPKEPLAIAKASAPGQMLIATDPGHECQGALQQDGEGGPPVAKPLLSSEKGSRALEQTRSSSQRPAPEVPYATLSISKDSGSTARATLKPEAREGREFGPATKLLASPLPTSQVAAPKAVLPFQGNSSGTTVAKLSPSAQALRELPSRQQLSRSILASLSVEQTVEDLRLSLAQGLEMGYGELRAEYPVCRQCGSCSAMCPHPRTQQDPLLHIFPRLTVRNGNVLMGLDFHLKINKTHARKWGLPETAEEGKAQEQLPERCGGGGGGIKEGISANPGPRVPCKPSGVMVQHLQMGTQIEATSSSVQVSLGKKLVGKGKCLPPPGLERQLQQGPPQAGHHPGRGPKEVPTTEKPSRNPVKRMLHVIKQAWTRIRGNKEKLVQPPEKWAAAGARRRLGTPPVKDSSRKRSTRATSANPKALGFLATQAATAAAAPLGQAPPICRVKPSSSGNVKCSPHGQPPRPSRQPSSQLGAAPRKGPASRKPAAYPTTPAFGGPQKSGLVVNQKPSVNVGMAPTMQVGPPASFKSTGETGKACPKKESPGTTRKAGCPLPKRAPTKKVWFLASK